VRVNVCDSSLEPPQRYGWSGKKFEWKVDYKMQEICVGFEVALSEKKLKNKICTLCYGTGSVTQPNGVKVPCPKGCSGYYPPH
jgi:hypothetical protein